MHGLSDVDKSEGEMDILQDKRFYVIVIFMMIMLLGHFRLKKENSRKNFFLYAEAILGIYLILLCSISVLSNFETLDWVVKRMLMKLLFISLLLLFMDKPLAGLFSTVGCVIGIAMGEFIDHISIGSNPNDMIHCSSQGWFFSLVVFM